MSHGQLRHRSLDAAARSGAHARAPTLCGLRRGGASHDRAFRQTELLPFRGRGQWRSDRSLIHHEKSGRRSVEKDKLPKRLLQERSALEAEGSSTFERRCALLLTSHSE